MKVVTFELKILFVGKESDYVLFSAVRSGVHVPNLGLAGMRPWLAVSLSRAKKGLIIVGNRETLEVMPIWKVVIEKLAEIGAIVNI